jgi:cell division protein FtsB
LIISDKVITAILSTISAIAVGYVPVWIARIQSNKPLTQKQQITKLKRENERLKKEIKMLKEGE